MKRTTTSTDAKAFEKLKELIHDIDVAMVTTVTVDGGLRSRPMVTRQFEDDAVRVRVVLARDDEDGVPCGRHGACVSVGIRTPAALSVRVLGVVGRVHAGRLAGEMRGNLRLGLRAARPCVR